MGYTDAPPQCQALEPGNGLPPHEPMPWHMFLPMAGRFSRQILTLLTLVSVASVEDFHWICIFLMRCFMGLLWDFEGIEWEYHGIVMGRPSINSDFAG